MRWLTVLFAAVMMIGGVGVADAKQKDKTTRVHQHKDNPTKVHQHKDNPTKHKRRWYRFWHGNK